MANENEFEREFLIFLQSKAFTDDLEAAQIMERTDLMVRGLTTKLMSQLGTRLTLADLASQGKVGGGVPHVVGPGPRRVDLLLWYAMDSSPRPVVPTDPGMAP